MAADAHGDLAFTGLGVALDALGLGGCRGPQSDSQSEYLRQRFVHFARTIVRKFRPLGPI